MGRKSISYCLIVLLLLPAVAYAAFRTDNLTVTQNANIIGNITGKLQGKNKGVSIYNITNSSDLLLWKAGQNLILTNVDMVSIGTGNVTGVIDECNSTGGTCAGINATWFINDNTQTSITSFTDNAIASGNWLKWNTTVVNGTPTNFAVTIKYSEN